MNLLADTHIHIYPCHEAGRLMAGAARRLRSFGGDPSASVALFLTEARQHDYFSQLKEGRHGLSSDFQVIPQSEPEAVRVQHGDEADLWIFAGRQIVTEERLEVLALTLAEGPEDGAPAAEVVAQVQQRGAIAVLPWAAGKWLFKRAKIVQGVLEQFPPDQLLLADSSMRSWVWPTPSFFQDRDRPVLAGSDPLPLKGEEDQAGGYGIRWDLAFDPARPVTSVRNGFRTHPPTWSRIGSRNTLLEMAHRLWRLRRAPKTTKE